MKKALSLIIVIVLCLSVLLGCILNARFGRREIFCRVVCLEDDGIIVDAGFSWNRFHSTDYDYGYIYVKNLKTDLDIGLFDTVVIKFSKADLMSATGEFLELEYNEKSYSYILDNPENIRFADASNNEPTYG